MTRAGTGAFRGSSAHGRGVAINDGPRRFPITGSVRRHGWPVAGENVAGYRETHRQWLAKLEGKRFVAVTELPKAGEAVSLPTG